MVRVRRAVLDGMVKEVLEEVKSEQREGGREASDEGCRQEGAGTEVLRGGCTWHKQGSARRPAWPELREG